jgi:hypothetical protein
MRVSPLRFFAHDRLDLVVKYRFFDMLLRGVAAPEAGEMYTRHIIARTGGVEPGNSPKTNINLYLTAARCLLRRMAERGFDPSEPIPLDQWGRLRDGAHRVACAAVLGLQVEVFHIEAQYPIRQWGIDWFLANGFSRRYVNELLDHMNIITGYANGPLDPVNHTNQRPRKQTVVRP